MNRHADGLRVQPICEPVKARLGRLPECERASTERWSQLADLIFTMIDGSIPTQNSGSM
jgi:hypothetical protein